MAVLLRRGGEPEARLSARLTQTLQVFRGSFNGSVRVVASSDCGRYALVLGVPLLADDAALPDQDSAWQRVEGPAFCIFDEDMLGGPLPLH
jgi:hypothetical protein